MSPAAYYAPDGTPLYSPFGTLIEDADDGRVRCHLCGRWYRALGPAHLPRVHGIDADTYRLLVGLRAQRPLQATAQSKRQSRDLRERLRDNRRLREGAARAQQRARDGQLHPLGVAAHAARPRTGERLASLKRSGSSLGTRRARHYAEQRQARVRALGDASVEEYLHRRYVQEKTGVAEMARELACDEATVTRLMNLAGIPRMPQHERLALAHAALRARERARRAGLERRAEALSFNGLFNYLADRQAKGWTQRRMAEELGTYRNLVWKLLRSSASDSPLEDC